MKKYLLLLISSIFIFSGFSSSFLPSYDYCILVRVIDGDTVECNCTFRGNRVVRLFGIDTFEVRSGRKGKRQAFSCGVSIDKIILMGAGEKEYLETLLHPPTPVLLQLHDRRYGFYGRLTGTILLPTKNKWLNVNNIMKNYHENIVNLNCTHK